MNKNEIRNKIYTYFGPDVYSEATIKLLEVMLSAEEPVFKFALREDIKDQKQFLPTKAEPKATGYDIRAAIKEPLVIKPFGRVLIPLGFRAFCPEGWWFELKPRSSTFGKKHLHTLIGTIDETFEGEALLAAQYIPQLELLHINDTFIKNYNETLAINPGDALGQIIPIKRVDMKVIETSNEGYNELCKIRNGQRGDGGFGSTGI
jgi:dUTP pyrophosphatase